MKLSDFIRSNIEEISAEWENFAATLLPEQEFSVSILRDGIVAILQEIAIDMDGHQNAQQQQEKSEGDQARNIEKDNAAETHALARVRMGLSSRQLISEFRALRATVLRLWEESDQAVDKRDIYDITRFNEAIDQALTEAAVRYTEKVEQSRELFLGILGHDLRTPLGAISGLADLLARGIAAERHTEMATQILICAGRMSHMITDLIELTRVQLGAGLSINRAPVNIRQMCLNALAEMRALHPKCIFELDCAEDIMGNLDEPRMHQVLSNLLSNAAQHGAAHSPIRVKAQKVKDGIELQVHNEGAAIPQELMPILFDRFIQGKSGLSTNEGHSTSLGLGLYIAKEIIVAHGGSITVLSSHNEGTTFVVLFRRGHEL